MAMGDIKVTPEQLRKVAGTIRSTIMNATATQERLKRDIDMISSNWLGSTYMKFNTDFRDSSFKMAQFIIILEPLEKFLLDSANKFEQVDNMDIAIAMASAYLGKPVLDGETNFFNGEAKLQEGKRFGFEVNGSLVEGQYKFAKGNELAFKAIGGSSEVNLPFTLNSIKDDVMEGKTIGIKTEVTGLEASIQTDSPIGVGENLKTTQKFATGSYIVGVDEYSWKNEYAVALHSYELELSKIDIPDFIPILGGYDVTLKGEYAVGSYGYKFNIGKETGGYVTTPNGYGGGFSFKFSKEKKE
ncbi:MULTISPECIES: WXG100 family type VII secretion target [Bacillus cereus group]|nr:MULTISPECIES: WXG100 family type VII secretion target [Bacillus cereus group]MCC2324952.1 WXG100 family type VII secretion target [Bacillus wiedmannii]MDP1460014.1 WXG100 family type VII secretion target [Bacillus wiedmannii]MED2015548.1 WXG100 family type VII secretion target [Bacillus wiedmannii]PEJ71399.1 type VII secretion protein [Bacillus wiedmannii]TKI11361.1 WXG100 family type VII secretion target [Bacillus wiedmannii]